MTNHNRKQYITGSLVLIFNLPAVTGSGGVLQESENRRQTVNNHVELQARKSRVQIPSSYRICTTERDAIGKSAASVGFTGPSEAPEPIPGSRVWSRLRSGRLALARGTAQCLGSGWSSIEMHVQIEPKKRKKEAVYSKHRIISDCGDDSRQVMAVHAGRQFLKHGRLAVRCSRQKMLSSVVDPRFNSANRFLLHQIPSPAATERLWLRLLSFHAEICSFKTRDGNFMRVKSLVFVAVLRLYRLVRPMDPVVP